MTALARVTNAILKQVNEIKGGKVLAQEAIDSLSLLALANTELNNRRAHKTGPAHGLQTPLLSVYNSDS